MKRSRKVLSWIVGALLVLLVVVVIVIATFDWNRLKPYLNEKVSQALGRPFAINGDLSVAWQREPAEGGLAALMPWPEFTARDIQIANPSWANKPQFAHLDGLRFRLSPLGLLAHRISITSLQLLQPSIDLERNKQGQATWDFSLPQGNAPSAWALDLGAIGFDRGQIALDDAASRVKLQLSVEPLQQAIPYDQIVAQESADARTQAGKTAGAAAGKAVANAGNNDTDSESHAASKTSYQFAWKANGTYQGVPANGSGRIGAVLALQQNGQPFPVQARLHIGDSHIVLVGTLTDPTHLAALDLKLWFTGSSMAKLYPIIGVTLPDTPPYATEGRLKAELHRNGSHFSYQHFRGRVGGSDLAGDLDYTTGGARPKLSGTVKSQLLQFADLAPLIGADSNTEKQQRGDATSQPVDKALPVEPFRTDRWQAMDADVQFSTARIVHGPSLPIESLSTHLIMTDGLLQLDPLNFGLAGGTISSHIHLDGSKSPMQGALKLSARHLKLKQLFPEFAPMQTSFGEINGDADLGVRGNSVAALLAHANGELKLLMNDGAISKTLLETAGLNVGNIVIGKLFGDKTVKINCAASDLVATDGLFDARLFVFDTEDATINVSGTANMTSEQLNLDVTPHTKGFRIFSLRSPLYVKGTLKNPDVGVQKGPLLIRGAGAVALGVVAAPAAALLALVAPSHDNANANTCSTILEQMRAPAKAMPAGNAHR
ncbi:AsmA family protein [Dyella sp. S184]|uniref:AsmA family protein n=1 Tax=Dyella sp. S184 TaxID=1641862 RepID=UPI00131D179A|nr:AsmA family protein [Dyella sp. S184]